MDRFLLLANCRPGVAESRKVKLNYPGKKKGGQKSRCRTAGEESAPPVVTCGVGRPDGWSAQWDSPLTELASPRGDEERDRPFSVFSELEPFWLWRSVAEEAALDEGLAFSLKSVMMTVKSPTVTSRCWALLRSMFFNLGLAGGRGKKKKRKKKEKKSASQILQGKRG